MNTTPATPPACDSAATKKRVHPMEEWLAEWKRKWDHNEKLESARFDPDSGYNPMMAATIDDRRTHLLFDVVSWLAAIEVPETPFFDRVRVLALIEAAKHACGNDGAK